MGPIGVGISCSPLTQSTSWNTSEVLDGAYSWSGSSRLVVSNGGHRGTGPYRIVGGPYLSVTGPRR